MNTLRELADAQWILPTFFSKFILMMRGKCDRNVSHESAYQTQLKSRRMCLNDTGNFSHLERSPHFNFFGPRSMIFAVHRLGFIHTKPTAWNDGSCYNLLLESDSSGLEKGIMCHASVKKNYQADRFWDLWHWPISRCHEGPAGNFLVILSRFTKTL